MAQGRGNAGIAQALSLSESSVEKHVNAIFTKLDLASEQQVHRRVAAVLTFLRDASLAPARLTTRPARGPVNPGIPLLDQVAGPAAITAASRPRRAAPAPAGPARGGDHRVTPSARRPRNWPAWTTMPLGRSVRRDGGRRQRPACGAPVTCRWRRGPRGGDFAAA